MSDAQDKLRRLNSLRSPRSRQKSTYNVADFDAEGNHISPTVGEDDALVEIENGSESQKDREGIENGLSQRQSFFQRVPSEPSLPLAQLVPGYEIVNEVGLCYCTVQAFPLEEARGPSALGNLLEMPPALFHRYHPSFGVGQVVNYRHAAFIDTETTGLGGGAGVYAFMVGVGTFETYQPYSPDQLPVDPDPNAPPSHFVVRQFFMRNPAEEGPLLVALSDLLARYEMTVTFNGRSFDLPLLRMRYSQNRRFLPSDRTAPLLDANRPHLDLLMPARKVWRRRLQSCRLINLEQMILGLHRSEDDVPGYLIPELYQHYVQTGYAGAMRQVFYHNNEDIVTMVAIADHLSRAFGELQEPTEKTTTNAIPTPTPPSHTSPAPITPSPMITGMDWAGLGRAHEGAGDLPQAITAYTRALDSVTNPTDRGEIFRSLGEIYKRQGQWTQATETWQTWLTSVAGSDSTPYVELAKYHEWQARDLEQAEMWTAWALHNLKKAQPHTRRPGEQRDLEHRLARIQRKRTSKPDTATDTAPNID